MSTLPLVNPPIAVDNLEIDRLFRGSFGRCNYSIPKAGWSVWADLLVLKIIFPAGVVFTHILANSIAIYSAIIDIHQTPISGAHLGEVDTSTENDLVVSGSP